MLSDSSIEVKSCKEIFFITHKINVLIEPRENVHMALTNLYVGKAGDFGVVKCLGVKSI